MRLHEYVANVLAGSRQGWSSEESKASDSLVQVFVRVEKQRAEVESLRPASVFDEGDKSKLDVLSKKIEHNQAVLAKLETVCSQLGMNDSFSITGLKQRTMELREEDRYLLVNYSQDLDPYLQLEAGLGAGASGLHKQHPKVIEMTSKMEARRADIGTI